MLPGMERKLTEHMLVHHYTATASEASGRSLQEVPLLKGSFGHHSSSIAGVASSSQESLYGPQHQQQPPGPIMTSDSLHSLRGGGGHHQHHRASASIPVTAEIVPVVPSHQQHHWQQQPCEAANEASLPPNMSSSVSSGAITSSSFLPSTSVSSSATTLARSLENGYAGGQPAAAHHMGQMRLQSVNSRLTSSPILVDTHVRNSDTLAMTTMPRGCSNMHHSNGNGGPNCWTA